MSLLPWPSRSDVWRDGLESLVLLDICDDHQNRTDDHESVRGPGVFEQYFNPGFEATQV